MTIEECSMLNQVNIRTGVKHTVLRVNKTRGRNCSPQGIREFTELRDALEFVVEAERENRRCKVLPKAHFIIISQYEPEGG